MTTKAPRAKTAAKESDFRAVAEFRYHIESYLDFSDQAAKAAGIEPKQYQLLLSIRGLPDDGGRAVGALAHTQRTRTGTRVFVELTRKGESVLTRAVEERLEELRVAGPVLVKALRQLTNNNHRSD